MSPLLPLAYKLLLENGTTDDALLAKQMQSSILQSFPNAVCEPTDTRRSGETYFDVDYGTNQKARWAVQGDQIELSSGTPEMWGVQGVGIRRGTYSEKLVKSGTPESLLRWFGRYHQAFAASLEA